MFFIPSKNIPTLFNASEVMADFETICQRASNALKEKVSKEDLMNVFMQVAEDELNHRFQNAIHSSKRDTLSKRETLSETTNNVLTRADKPVCCVQECTTTRLNKPYHHDGNVYCSKHYKHLAKATKPTSRGRKKIQIQIPEIEAVEVATEEKEEVKPTEGEVTPGESKYPFGPPRHIDRHDHFMYWTFCKITYVDDEGQNHTFRLHKATGLVVDLTRNPDKSISMKLIGMFLQPQNEFIDKKLIADNVIEWCILSGITV